MAVRIKKTASRPEDPMIYYQNARQILSEKAGKEEGFYQHPKYVKMAGNTLWSGVLLAVDLHAASKGKNVKSRGRKSIEEYKDYIDTNFPKLYQKFLSAYQILHLFMGYDGCLEYRVVKVGLELAKELIEAISPVKAGRSSQ